MRFLILNVNSKRKVSMILCMQVGNRKVVRNFWSEFANLPPCPMGELASQREKMISLDKKDKFANSPQKLPTVLFFLLATVQ